MRKWVVSMVLAGAMAAAPMGIAFAGSDNHATLGTPGTPNCVGQSMAYLAQVGTSVGIHGIGNVADALNLSVQEVHTLVEAYCNQ